MSTKGRKEKYRDIFASSKKTDYFGTIFDSMCRSKDYKDLSLGAKHFYTLCRVQARSKAGRACLYAHSKEFNNTYDAERYFVFPAKHQEAYGVLRQNGNRYLQELERAGFIEKVEQNNHIKKVNVYRFSRKWQEVVD